MYLKNDNEAVRPLMRIIQRSLLLLFLFVCTTNAWGFVAQDSTDKTANASPEATELNVLSYNIQLLPRFFTPFTRHVRLMQGKRTQWIIDYLKNEKDYDVIVFQEVFAKPLCRKLIKALKEKYPYYVKPEKRKGAVFRGGSGLLVLSKYPIVDEELLFYRNGVEFEWIATKGAVWTRIEKDGVRFQLVGTHLQSQHKDIAQKEREYQLQQIVDLVERKAENDEAVIFAGDFNIPRSHETWYGNFMDILQAEIVELKDPRPYTFDEQNDWISGDFYQHEQLDYFLFRSKNKNCSLLEQKIIRPTQLFKGEEIDLADHYGLEAVFELSND